MLVAPLARSRQSVRALQNRGTRTVIVMCKEPGCMPHTNGAREHFTRVLTYFE